MVKPYRIRRASNGQFYGVTLARNGRVLSTTEPMHRRASVVGNFLAQAGASGGMFSAARVLDSIVDESDAPRRNGAPRHADALRRARVLPA